MRTIILMALAVTLSGCGDSGAYVFPNQQAAWPGLNYLRFGEDCDGLADRLRKEGLLYIMSDGTDPTKTRSDGSGISLKKQSYMGVPAGGSIDCKDNDGVSSFRVIGDEAQLNTAKFEELIPFLIRNWTTPSRETTESARSQQGSKEDFPNVYWDNIGGTAVHARLGWHVVTSKVLIYVTFKPSDKQ